MQFNPDINESGPDPLRPRPSAAIKPSGLAGPAGGPSRSAAMDPAAGPARGQRLSGGGATGAPRDVASAAHRYHALISSMRFGEAFDACWDEQIEMRWLDGRIFRGFGTCAAMISSALARAVVLQLISHEPVVHARGYTIEVVSRQHWLEDDLVFQTSRIFDHILDPLTFRITQIAEQCCRLRGISPDGASRGLPVGQDLEGAEALAWLGSRGV